MAMTHNQILEKASRILEERAKYNRESMSTPTIVKEIALRRIGHLEYEVFIAFWLDAQNGLIDVQEMFRGTLTQTSVYPREVVKSAMSHNAAGVIFAHNHPSGIVQPSSADIHLTTQLKSALSMVDVRVLDHIVCGTSSTCSMAETGHI